jgi:hypothetical protein
MAVAGAKAPENGGEHKNLFLRCGLACGQAFAQSDTDQNAPDQNAQPAPRNQLVYKCRERGSVVFSEKPCSNAIRRRCGK